MFDFPTSGYSVYKKTNSGNTFELSPFEFTQYKGSWFEDSEVLWVVTSKRLQENVQNGEVCVSLFRTHLPSPDGYHNDFYLHSSL